MKLNEYTSQESLGKLYETVVRMEYRRSTPLNFRQFFGFLLLFVLFPAMVLGFWVGMIATGVFCLALFALLYLGHGDWGMILAGVWLVIGLLILTYVTLAVMKRGRAVRAKRLTQRKAEPGGTGIPAPMRAPLNWHKKGKDGSIWKASIALQAPEDGIYALLLELPKYSGARFSTVGITGCSIVHSAGAKGGLFQALLLYKLSAGRHILEWHMGVAPDEEKPAAFVTQLNRPDQPGAAPAEGAADAQAAAE